jgi:Holliday junction resolvase
MMGKAQRTKGATFERDVVNALKAAGIDAARNLDQTRDGGGDIDVGAYMIECKRRASIAVYDWLDQCTRAARPGQIPVVVARGDRREAVVILRLDDFIPMLEKETKE